MGKFTASSIELMAKMKPANFPRIDNKKELFRKCIYEWEVEPPRLPKNAKKIDVREKNDFELYKTKKGKYLVIRDDKDLKKAKKLAKEIGCKIVLPNN